MKNTKQLLRQYDVSFAGLKEGIHWFDFEVRADFFQAFDYNEFDDVKQAVRVKLNKKSNLLEFSLHSEGIVCVPCDVTGELFDLSTSNTLDLVVKFGEVYNDDSDEFLVLPLGEHKLNLSQYIYEMIVLSVPLKRVSPSGFNEQEIQALENKTSYEEPRTDPRWDKLKELLNK